MVHASRARRRTNFIPRKIREVFGCEIFASRFSTVEEFVTRRSFWVREDQLFCFWVFRALRTKSFFLARLYNSEGDCSSWDQKLLLLIDGDCFEPCFFCTSKAKLLA